MREGDVQNIAAHSNTDLDPATYSLLYNCPATSLNVERSFSMLKRMLRVDRNFSSNSIEAYFMSYYSTNSGYLGNVEILESEDED